MGEVTSEDIKKDEEIFVNYGYGLNQAPEWYGEEYKKFQKEHPDMAAYTLEEEKKEDKDKNDKTPVEPDQMNVVVPWKF